MEEFDFSKYKLHYNCDIMSYYKPSALFSRDLKISSIADFRKAITYSKKCINYLNKAYNEGPVDEDLSYNEDVIDLNREEIKYLFNYLNVIFNTNTIDIIYKDWGLIDTKVKIYYEISINASKYPLDESILNYFLFEDNLIDYLKSIDISKLMDVFCLGGYTCNELSFITEKKDNKDFRLKMIVDVEDSYGRFCFSMIYLENDNFYVFTENPRGPFSPESTDKCEYYSNNNECFEFYFEIFNSIKNIINPKRNIKSARSICS